MAPRVNGGQSRFRYSPRSNQARRFVVESRRLAEQKDSLAAAGRDERIDLLYFAESSWALYRVIIANSRRPEHLSDRGFKRRLTCELRL